MKEMILADDSVSMVEVPKEISADKKGGRRAGVVAQSVVVDSDLPPSCLRNEKVTVRYIMRESGNVTNPKHVFYGGMANDAYRSFTVPMLRNGEFVNVLTNDEKNYLEYVMGLEVNALSIYLKNDNYWDNYQVRLTKGDNLLDLSNPNDYIDYKVLLANKDIICPSITGLQDYPKATYQFVILTENEEQKNISKEMNETMESYMELGKIVGDVDTLRVIVELITGRPTPVNAKVEYLQTQCNRLIQDNSKVFVQTIKDPLLPNKVLLRRAKDNHVVSTKGNYYYYEGVPLCNTNEDPTLNIAAKYLGLPKSAEIKFSIEAKLK
jgi:hypothetical protein